MIQIYVLDSKENHTPLIHIDCHRMTQNKIGKCHTSEENLQVILCISKLELGPGCKKIEIQ